MTTEELRSYFNNTFALDVWPSKFEVDAETYGNVCHDIFNHLWDKKDIQWLVGGGRSIEVSLGKNKGLMFKNVELILKR